MKPDSRKRESDLAEILHPRTIDQANEDRQTRKTDCITWTTKRSVKMITSFKTKGKPTGSNAEPNGTEQFPSSFVLRRRLTIMNAEGRTHTPWWAV